jgi:hypothetical protein
MNNFIVPRRGHDIGGLVVYLFGPGEANEHTDQRIIAADDTFDIADGTRGDRPEHWPKVLELGRQMDAHRRLLGVKPAGGHVWHCAISLPPREAISDAKWAQVARAAMEALGFAESSGKAPCRWIAVHHGRSAGGNEHIHLAVNLVREDGTLASTWRDRRTMSRVCARFEHEFGLHIVDGRAGRGMPGYSRAEAERARRCRTAPDRVLLARTVRACETASASEAEFVRRLTKAGVLARPRYAAGGRQAVTGYSVALRPDGDSAPVWMGGGRLAADLTLPRLRGHWAAMEPGIDAEAARAEALAEWRHLTGDGPAGSPAGAEIPTYAPESWATAANRVAAVRKRLATVPYDDSAAWSTAARQAAGILAALSARLETTPGPLADAADALARSAQTRSGQGRYARHSGLANLRGVALVVRQATIPPCGPSPWIVLLRQLIRLIDAISRAHNSRHQLQHAAILRRIADQRLATLTRPQAAPAISAVDFPADPGIPIRPARTGPAPHLRPPDLRQPGPNRFPGR